MKTPIIRTQIAAGHAASALAASAPALAHDGHGRFERRDFRHEHFRHFRPAPRVLVERPVVVHRPAYVGPHGSVYYTERAPAYYIEPAPVYYEAHPNWGIVGGAIIGAAIGSQLVR
jgi:hypothetical protein